jgi:hypothetical protein
MKCSSIRLLYLRNTALLFDTYKNWTTATANTNSGNDNQLRGLTQLQLRLPVRRAIRRPEHLLLSRRIPKS